MGRTKLVAEIGGNHRGDFELVLEMIKMAAVFCRADVIKFAKHDQAHPLFRPGREFEPERHQELKRYCENFGITYSCSVWDLPSAQAIAGIKPDMIKIPSACNLERPMLEWLCRHYGGQLHLALGMTTRAEEAGIIELFRSYGRMKDLVIYGCTSGYPAPQEDVCLLEIRRLADNYSGEAAAVGFSGHHKGICFDIAAMTLGALYVERHFTLDRTWESMDQAVSLGPDGLRQLKRDMESTEKALTYRGKEILDCEICRRRRWKDRRGDYERTTTDNGADAGQRRQQERSPEKCQG